MVRFILMDIEGTTTAIDFVHKVLFPYSAERLERFVQTHADDAEVRTALDMVQETVRTEEGRDIDDGRAVQTLLAWIQADRKHTALKKLQGLIWKEGFETGAYQGHVYDDVPPCLESWKNQGIGLGIYSSGSVQAQQLLFGHSTFGDLTPYFSRYFDTAVGGKREQASYERIARELDLPPAGILFLSDVEEELSAAAGAGFKVMQLVREDALPSRQFPHVGSFAEIRLSAPILN